jgi:hypothetical protein
VIILFLFFVIIFFCLCFLILFVCLFAIFFFCCDGILHCYCSLLRDVTDLRGGEILQADNLSLLQMFEGILVIDTLKKCVMQKRDLYIKMVFSKKLSNASGFKTLFFVFLKTQFLKNCWAKHFFFFFLTFLMKMCFCPAQTRGQTGP